jgi:predicted nucleic acid-binding protein
MILVADCSALVALSVCGSLNLLERLFASVVVPETVYVEATRPDKNQAQALKIFLKGKVCGK